MSKLQLYLSNGNDARNVIRLERIVYRVRRTSKPVTTTRSRSSIYQPTPTENLFSWTAAVRAFTLLAVRTHRDRCSQTTLIGGPNSPAASLDWALSKEPGWLLDFFGLTRDALSRARYIFIRKDSERRRGPFEIRFNPSKIKPSGIEVYLGGELVRSDETLDLIISDLERQGGAQQTEIGSSRSEVRDPMRIRRPEAKGPSADLPSPGTYAIKSLLIKALVIGDNRRIRYTTVATLKNISREPLEFFHWRIFTSGSAIENFFVTANSENCTTHLVDQALGLLRYIVRLPQALPPGDTISLEIQHDACGKVVHSGELKLSVIKPTDSIAFDIAAESRTVERAVAVADASDAVMFGELPEVEFNQTAPNRRSARWTLSNPPTGFVYRLVYHMRDVSKSSTSQDRPPTALLS